MSASVNSPRSPFVVGVTGDTDLPTETTPDLRWRFANLFTFIQRGARALAAPHPNSTQADSKVTCWEALGLNHEKGPIAEWAQWPGLGDNTPVVLLSALGPGPERLAAEVALDLGIDLRAPLPFPEPVLRQKLIADDTSKEEWDQLEPLLACANHFPIFLEKDLLQDAQLLGPAYEAERTQLFEQDYEDPDAYNRRRRAAGEYVAAFCDLLISIIDSEATIDPVVEAKRKGLEPGLLALTPAFHWSDNGPVFQLCQPNSSSKSTDPGAVSEEPRLRVLYPYDLAPARYLDGPLIAQTWDLEGDQNAIVRSHQKANKHPQDGSIYPEDFTRIRKHFLKWHHDGFSLFRRISNNVATFNAWQPNSADKKELETAIELALEKECGIRLRDRKNRDLPPNKVRSEFTKRFGKPALKSKDNSNRTESEGDELRVYLEKLRPIAELRAKAAFASRKNSEYRARTMRTLFLLTFCAAVFMHLFAHWHPRTTGSEQSNGHHAGHSAIPQPTLVATHEAHDEHSESTDAPSPAPPSPHSSHHSPLRPVFGVAALLLALGALSIFAKYRINRIDEIHNDNRALAEGLRVQFSWALSGLRRSVPANYMQRQRSELDWIRAAISATASPYESRQIDFLALTKDNQATLFQLAKTSWIDAQASYHQRSSRTQLNHLHFWHGLGSVLALAGLWQLIFLIFFTIFPALEKWLNSSVLHSIGGGIIGLLLAGTILILSSLWTLVRHLRGSGSNHPSDTIPQAILGFLAPVSTTGLDLMTPTQRAFRRLKNFGIFSIPAAALASALLGILLFPIALLPTLPDLLNLGIVSMGACLLSGALAVAWAEKNFYSEHAYQYSAMATLYQATSLRYQELLYQFKAVPEDSDELPHARQRLHALLFAVGKEALDENAEWLILHRSRPMEPVMAG